MPDFLPKMCALHGCRSGKLALHGARYCADHLQNARDTRREFDKSRDASEPWRLWYHRKPWTGKNGLQKLVISRHPICQKCNRNASTVADHIKPHKGVWALFVDWSNLQGLCKQCHDEKTGHEKAEAEAKFLRGE